MRPLTPRRRRGVPLLLGLLVLPLAACAGSDEAGPAATFREVGPDDGWAGARLDDPYEMPAVTLTDTEGRAFDLAEDTDAPVTLVFFGYTSCPDVCSTVLADAASALRRAAPEVREDTELVFITTDPARDTPEVVADYLARFDPAFVGLTGELPVIEQAAESLGVALEGTTQLPGGGYDVSHGTQLIGFGPDGLGHVVWTPGTTVGGLREDVTRLAGGA